jgi:ribonuclease Z
MKTSFLPRLVNGQTGDPALFVDILHEKRGLLFDCGTLSNLSPSEVLRVTDVFISHAHIDHFIGFDHLLRLHLGRGKRIRVHGPRGITGCVRGKLSGYTWNLVKRQRLVFEVREWDGKKLKITEFHCRQRFRQGDSRHQSQPGVLWEDEIISVKSVVLDHKIPSLAFSVCERDFYNVDPVQLEALGHRPGPWLNQLKSWARRGGSQEETIQIEDRPGNAAELAESLLIVTPGKTIVYVADAQGNEKNFETIVSLAKEADLFFCEGAFLQADNDRAEETFHLTAQQAGQLARSAGVKRLVVFHFSPKYEGRFAELEQEAESVFRAGETTRPD